MTDNRTQATKAYIHSFLNEKISVRPLPMDLQKSTSFVLKSNYSCFSSAIMEKKVVLCYPKDEKTTTPSKVHRHLEMLESMTQHPAILVLTEVPSYNIKRLIDQRVNFIINGKQMFVLSLLMDLRKLPTKDRDIKEQIPPLAQCLILYTLQIGFIQNTINEISELFGVSYSTANRAARWLQSKGFLFTGNSKKVQFRCLGHELWDKAFPYLTSPVEKTITVDKVPKNSLLSGNSIIHNNTETYALYKDASKEITEVSDGKYTIEIWKYDSMVLSKDKLRVDALSLYLSIRHNSDEQISRFADKLLEESLCAIE